MHLEELWVLQQAGVASRTCCNRNVLHLEDVATGKCCIRKALYEESVASRILCKERCFIVLALQQEGVALGRHCIRLQEEGVGKVRCCSEKV